MTIVEPTALKDSVGTGRRLLGFDVGSRTIGLALSDAAWLIASPLTTVARTRLVRDLAAVQRLSAEHDVGGFVIGLPVGMDGREGPRCQSVRQFAADLVAAIDLPAAFWDERLSTRVVERMLIDEMNVSRQRRARIIDKLAATYILQGALDAIARAGVAAAGS
jgi:putative Holliday junction resolvase